jgi:hypothetical protein
MRKIIKLDDTKIIESPYFVTIICSLFFSIIAYTCEPYVNHDGILYLDAAKAYLEKGFAESFRAYSWPFYSFFIATLFDCTGLSIEFSAFIINTVLIVATCLLFLKIYSIVTNGEGNLWVAAFLILTLSGINKYRDDIMRDFGYWCFFLTGVLNLLLFYRKSGIFKSVLWQICLIIAFLFRSEALATIIAGPLIMFLKGINRRTCKDIISLYGVYILGFIFIALFVLLFQSESLGFYVDRTGNLFKFINIEIFLDNLDKSIRNIGDIFWYDGLNVDRYYGTLLTVFVVSMFCYTAIKITLCLSIPYAIVLSYGILKKNLSWSHDNIVIFYLASIQFIILITFLMQKLLLTPRYATVLVFFLLIYLGQIVENLLIMIKSYRYGKTIKIIFIALIVIQTGDALITFGGYSKRHVVMAGKWAKDNIEKNAPIYSHDLKALYYADRSYVGRYELPKDIIIEKIDNHGFSRNDYIIIHGKKETALKSQLSQYAKDKKIILVKEFNNKKKDWAIVCKIRD